jgi:hypothetical protein
MSLKLYPLVSPSLLPFTPRLSLKFGTCLRTPQNLKPPATINSTIDAPSHSSQRYSQVLPVSKPL